MFNLTALQLRFTCEALTPINLNGYNAGSNLRGALGNVMRRAYCPEADHFSARKLHPAAGNGRQPDPEHVAACPVCWLLAANEHPGEERRGYALVPPLETQTSEVSENLRGLYAPGQRFNFGLTLFGDALRFLPYFILAVPEMGRAGVGAPTSGAGRGQFALRSVTARDPFDGGDQIVLAEGESLVHVPDQLITAERVQQAADRTLTLTPSAASPFPYPHSGGTAGRQGEGSAPRRVKVNFVTPMRLIDNEQLVKAPDFGVLFKRLLERLDELHQQFSGGGPRPTEEVQALQSLANQVRLIEAQTRWIELQSGSSRSGRTTWLSGFAGPAVYAAPFGVWRVLLPWLMWGTVTQVGKDVVKGNGVYEINVQ